MTDEMKDRATYKTMAESTFEDWQIIVRHAAPFQKELPLNLYVYPVDPATRLPDVFTKFAETVEKVCVDTVESGKMTKDLAILIDADAPYLTTDEYLDAVDAELKKRMG